MSKQVSKKGSGTQNSRATLKTTWQTHEERTQRLKRRVCPTCNGCGYVDEEEASEDELVSDDGQESVEERERRSEVDVREQAVVREKGVGQVNEKTSKNNSPNSNVDNGDHRSSDDNNHESSNLKQQIARNLLARRADNSRQSKPNERRQQAYYLVPVPGEIPNADGTPPVLSCPEGCGFVADTRPKLFAHMSRHRLLRHACTHPGCKKRFAKPENLKCHMKVHELGGADEVSGKTKKYKCSYDGCAYETKSEATFDVHINRTHLGKLPFVCEHEGCGRRFGSAIYLKRHDENYHKGKPLDTIRKYGCSWEGCVYRTDHPSHLREHMHTHTGERPYVCTFGGCSANFAKQRHLQTHTLIHTGEKKVQCSHPGCSYATFRKSHLKIHMRTHTGERPCVCHVDGCGKTYTTSGNLFAHKRKAHNITG